MPKEKIILRKITVGLRKPEQRVIDAAIEDGYETSELIRQLIREFGEKAYPTTPAYAEALKDSVELRKAKAAEELALKNMSNEDYATKILHGRIVDGVKAGFRIVSGQEMYFPLSEIKQHTVENNQIIRIHNQLLDKTFININGQPLSETEYKRIFKGWEK